MTRAEAAAQAADALSRMMCASAIVNKANLRRSWDDVMAQGRAAEADLAAALLVLTEPPETVFGVDPAIPRSDRTIATAWCCGRMFETYSAWEVHMHSSAHKP